MKKILRLITFIVLSLNAFSQEEAQYVSVAWKPGTEKSVYRIDSTIIYINDRLFTATGIRSDYKIRIVSLKDTVYEVLFKQFNVAESSIETGQDVLAQAEGLMKDIIADLQHEFQGFEYTFLVNKNTALAFEVKNEQEMAAKMEKAVTLVVNRYIETFRKDTGKDRSELERLLHDFVSQQMPDVLETMENSFNYIFQAYSFPYTPGKSYTTEMMVYSIDQVEHGDQETPATIVINSSLNGKKLEMDYEYLYDKAAAYEQFIVARGNEQEVPIDEFEISEHIIAGFDLKSSWIQTSSSFVKVKMGNVRVSNSSYVKIQ